MHTECELTNIDQTMIDEVVLVIIVDEKHLDVEHS